MENRYEKNNFIEIVKDSSNISEIARKLDLTTGHGNRQTIQNYIKKYN